MYVYYLPLFNKLRSYFAFFCTPVAGKFEGCLSDSPRDLHLVTLSLYTRLREACAQSFQVSTTDLHDGWNKKEKGVNRLNP